MFVGSPVNIQLASKFATYYSIIFSTEKVSPSMNLNKYLEALFKCNLIIRENSIFSILYLKLLYWIVQYCNMLPLRELCALY